MSRKTTCPRCKWNLLMSNPPPAISRRDNKTKICSQCGTREALEDAGLVEPWMDEPTNRPYWNTRSDVWLVQLERQHDKETGIDELKAKHYEMGGDAVILSDKIES